MRTIVENIGQLVAVRRGPAAGAAFSQPERIANAAVVIEDERIAWFGPAADAPRAACENSIDAGGGVVTPGLIDAHTHAVFAGSRAGEYVQRIGGRSYLEIMQAGGGIRSTMRAVRAASVEQLVEAALARLRRMLAAGVTTVEIKSGYGLSPAEELKMLRAIAEIRRQAPQEIVATYLGAHAVGPEFEGRPDDFVTAMSDDGLLAQIAGESLAEFGDVFCERGAFSVEQSQAFLAACRRHGLGAKIHAEQISHCGGAAMAAGLGAVSADHLEFASDADIAALKKAGTIPVLLPGCSFFLNTPPAPARKLIDAGLPVALATDCNPGSSMIESLPLVMSIACSMLRMTPAECLVACTANAAAALARADRLGAIAAGHQADLLSLDLQDLDEWPYRVGVNPVRTVIRRGRCILSNP